MSNICQISRVVIHFAIGPYNTSSEGEGIPNAPNGDASCPGLVGKNALEKKAKFVKLLERAEEEGATARKQGLDLMSKSGNVHKCKTCEKIDRRDRLLAHFLYKHLGLKTWRCVLWYVCFH